MKEHYMKNINYNTVYKGSSPELVELYVLGYDIQWLCDKWVDIPGYNDKDNYHNIWRITNTKYTFRVKPSLSFMFFHTDSSRFDKPKTISLMTFNYPESKPCGPYVMLKVDSKGKVIDSYSSTTKDVYDDDTFFKYC